MVLYEGGRLHTRRTIFVAGAEDAPLLRPFRPKDAFSGQRPLGYPINTLAVEIIPRTSYTICQCSSTADMILPCQDLRISPRH
jgi:hypothetical protein